MLADSAPSPRTRSAGRPTPLATPGRLYRLLLLCTLVGVVLPLLPWLKRQEQLDFPTWGNLLVEHPALGEAVAEHPALDATRLAPLIHALPWKPPRQPASIRYYKSFAVSNALLLVLFLLLRRLLRRVLTRAADWLHAREQRRARRIVFGWCSMVVVAFLTKTPLGFWIPAGIGGWTYAGLHAQLTPEPPAHLRPPSPEEGFLRLALQPENARYLPGPGYLAGPAMFLHFRGGVVLPGSYDLVDLAKPGYVFGPELVRVTRPGAFVAMVRNALALRRRGGRFLLPFGVAYPNHRAYPLIDYRGCPPPEDLERITFWRLTLHVDEARRVEIVSALREVSIDA